MRRPRGLTEILLICLVASGSCAGAVTGELALGERFDVVGIAQRTAAILAVVLLFALERPTLRDLRLDSLWSDGTLHNRLKVLIGSKCAVLVGVSGAGIIFEPTVVIVGVFAGVLLLLFVSHWVLISHMGRPAGDHSGDSVPQTPARGFGVLPPEGPSRPTLLTYTPPRFVDVVIEVAHRAWIAKLRITWPALLLATSAVLCGLTMLVGIATQMPRSSLAPMISSSHTSSGKTAAPPTVSTTQEHSPATHLPPKDIGAWSCPAAPYQSEAKEPAIASISKFYDGEPYPPHAETGCMGHIYPKHFYHEFYATMTGVDPENFDPLSLSIDSERYGPVLFLWAVATAIEELITELGPVGGVGRFPRYKAGAGEFYLVRTPRGIYMFIRRTITQSFVKLGPTVARAFLGSVREGAWLWPSQPTHGRGGEQIFQLRSDDSYNHPQGEITLRADGEAVRGHFRYPPVPAQELSLAELEAIAMTA